VADKNSPSASSLRAPSHPEPRARARPRGGYVWGVSTVEGETRETAKDGDPRAPPRLPRAQRCPLVTGESRRNGRSDAYASTH